MKSIGKYKNICETKFIRYTKKEINTPIHKVWFPFSLSFEISNLKLECSLHEENKIEILQRKYIKGQSIPKRIVIVNVSTASEALVKCFDIRLLKVSFIRLQFGQHRPSFNILN
jgi:hypothetical protein